MSLLNYFTYRNIFSNTTQKVLFVEIVHRENCDMCRNLHLCFCAQCRFVISAFGKIFALQICAFCARRFFAHLHICTFAHLHICRKFRTCKNVFEQFADSSKCFCEHARTCKIIFHNMCTLFWQIWEKRQNLEKVEISENVRFCPVGFWRVPENVRKKLTCSWVVHEWFLGQRVWQHRVAKVARICIN